MELVRAEPHSPSARPSTGSGRTGSSAHIVRGRPNGPSFDRLRTNGVIGIHRSWPTQRPILRQAQDERGHRHTSFVADPTAHPSTGSGRTGSSAYIVHGRPNGPSFDRLRTNGVIGTHRSWPAQRPILRQAQDERGHRHTSFVADPTAHPSTGSGRTGSSAHIVRGRPNGPSFDRLRTNGVIGIHRSWPTQRPILRQAQDERGQSAHIVRGRPNGPSFDRLRTNGVNRHTSFVADPTARPSTGSGRTGSIGTHRSWPAQRPILRQAQDERGHRHTSFVVSLSNHGPASVVAAPTPHTSFLATRLQPPCKTSRLRPRDSSHRPIRTIAALHAS